MSKSTTSILLSALVCLCYAGAARAEATGACIKGMDLPAGYRPFSAQSPWNTPIPADARTAPDSALMIQALKKEAGGFTASFEKWSMPVFAIDSKACGEVSFPTRRDILHQSVDPKHSLKVMVPMPPDAWPDPEEDGHMVLVDPEAQKAWEFSALRRKGNKPDSASCIFIWDLRGAGFVPPFSGDGWWTIGATASGLPIIGGLITRQEYLSGKIEHALLCALPTTRKSSKLGGPLELCPPAARSDGQSIGPESIPIGSRLQLDPTLDLKALGLSEAVMPVAIAMQRYGLIVSDSGPTFKTYFQNLGPDKSIWKSGAIMDELSKIPVDAFRVLDCTLVKKVLKP